MSRLSLAIRAETFQVRKLSKFMEKVPIHKDAAEGCWDDKWLWEEYDCC